MENVNENIISDYCLLEKGAKLIILGLPEGTEFGIDLQGWTIGNKFKGLKMIPPGFHFYYISIQNKYGDMAPRIGYCHYFHEKETLVKRYNPLEEGLCNVEREEATGCLQHFFKEIAVGLGPFPFECWTKWVSLTQHITYQELNRLISEKEFPSAFENAISSQSDHSTYTSVNEKSSTIGISCYSSEYDTSKSSEKLLTMMVSGQKIKYCKFPIRPYKEGATPSEISKGSIDSSYTMSFLFKQLNSPSELLSELQYSFISFLVGQEWDSWEQWKKLILTFCNAEETLVQNSNLYFDFLSVIHYQIQEVPEDMFVDIVEKENFLVVSLRTLFANIFENKSFLQPRLISKAQKFQRHLISKFLWNLDLEEEEDLPVVVEI